MALAAQRRQWRGPAQAGSAEGQSGDGRGGPHLPLVPSEKEKASYADRNPALITQASLASFGALLISQARFVRTEPVLLVFAPLLMFTVAYYLVSAVVNVGTRGFDVERHRALVRRWRPARYPPVDVFLPVCGEPLEVLRNTWSHVHEMARQYPGRMVVYVLDDGASEVVAAMADEYHFAYLVRPDRGWMKKAGNLRHGFANSDGEFIVILDADFAPRADLPLEMLPYLATDPSLGIVQSPQFFRVHRRQSWTERGAGAVQELFYRTVQVSRDCRNGAICVGSCAIYRREALAAGGGTTLIEHSEDVHTGFDLRRAGWGLRYIPVPLATGLCPSDPDSFLIQQYRWCAGAMSLMGARKFWTTRMPLRTRLCYLSGFCYYVHTMAFIFATPLIPIAMLTLMPQQVHLVNYLFVMPSIIYNFVVFPAWHRCRFGPTAFMVKLLYSWAHLFALLDILRQRQLGWQPTGGGQRKAGTARIWAGIWIWNGTTSAVWVLLAVWRAADDGIGNFTVLLMGGLFTAVITGMALAARRNHIRVASEGGRRLGACWDEQASRELASTLPQRAVAPRGAASRVPWPLLVLLAVQVLLSLRLIWANTAFLDEGTYIWAGRVELWHMLDGTPVPDYASYFSGAPSIYPPLAGIIDIIGGLPAVRLLSLAFMLGVTGMLWGTARSLFGQRAALSAVALFVIIGPTQFLGALSTYDAMGLFALTLSARLVVAARGRDDSTPLLIAAVAALVAANATKYATAIFDPVVIVMAMLTCPRGIKAGLGRAGLVATLTVAIIAALLALGGPQYLAGLELSTVARADGTSSPVLVATDSARWIGVVIALAAVGAAAGWWRRQRRWLLVALAVAGLLVPANQARIHTTVSLVKHVDFGAWFACLAAGYAISMLSAWGRGRLGRGVAAVVVAGVIALPAGAPGRAQALAFEGSWPDTTRVVATLGKLVREYPGPYLAEDQQVMGYYLENELPWQVWTDTWYLAYQVPGTRTCVAGSTSGVSLATMGSSAVGKALVSAIRHQYYALIMLDFGDTPAVDQVIITAIRRYHTYHLVAQVAGDDRFGGSKYLIWAPTPTAPGAAGSNCCLPCRRVVALELPVAAVMGHSCRDRDSYVPLPVSTAAAMAPALSRLRGPVGHYQWCLVVLKEVSVIGSHSSAGW